MTVSGFADRRNRDNLNTNNPQEHDYVSLDGLFR